MVETNLILLGISFILFFGLFAEFIFRKTNLPDLLLLIILGFLIGPYGLGLVDPGDFTQFAPAFTTFALLFLLYDGAYNIDLVSFAKGVTKSMRITLFSFFLSAVTITGIMLIFEFDILSSLLTGFMLGGISSTFAIPILNKLKVSKEVYSIITLESAITDVFTIVFALTVLEIINIGSFNVQVLVGSIVSLFAVAGLVGILAGVGWIFLMTRILKHNKAYMMTIAYVILVYVLTEFLKGNGAIACLFLGLILRNSQRLKLLFKLLSHRNRPEIKAEEFSDTVSVTSVEEKSFYDQISFFLKTFFFVYIGTIFVLNDLMAIVIGLTITFLVLVIRHLTKYVTKDFDDKGRKLISVMFARGLAAAAIVQFAFLQDIPFAVEISHIAYAVIAFTILASSIRIFMLKDVIATQDAAK
ncbi:MAG: cation:proton antiporter [Nanoarchaeota archaeon]